MPFPLEHGVEPRNAGRDTLVGCHLAQADRGDRKDRDAVLVDQERIFIGAMQAAAVFDDAQPSGRMLLGDAMVQNDYAVGHVLLEPLAGKRAVAALSGNDCRDTLVLEPAKQASQFRSQDGGVAQAAEERLDGIEHDALGADGVDGMAEADEQAFEIVLTGLLDLGTLDVDVVQQQFVFSGQLVQVEAEGAHILRQFLGSFLEGQEDTGFVELGGAANQEFDGQKRLAAARAAADQRGTTTRQSAAGDFIEALDARGRLGQRRVRDAVAGLRFIHAPPQSILRMCTCIRIWERNPR